MSYTVDVVMRSRNDASHLPATLAALAVQGQSFQLIAFDNASSDGGRELLENAAHKVLHVPAGTYVPGRVLNRAMRESTSEIVVFLNADCEPLDGDWLESLLQPFTDPMVGASFGRQVPRPDCLPLAAFDTESTYGDGLRQGAWRHCFSMASCAVRRSVWEQIQFDESLSFSEDIAWSWKVKQAGWSIQYVPESRAYHSHNYTNEQWQNRQYGEGKAEAEIFEWSKWQCHALRYSLLPVAKQIVRDLRHCVQSGHFNAIGSIPGYRFAQMIGRRRGFLDGRSNRLGRSASAQLAESL